MSKNDKPSRKRQKFKKHNKKAPTVCSTLITRTEEETKKKMMSSISDIFSEPFVSSGRKTPELKETRFTNRKANIWQLTAEHEDNCEAQTSKSSFLLASQTALMLAELRSSDSSQFTQYTMKSLQDSQNNDQTVNSTQETSVGELNQRGDNEDSLSALSCDKGSCLFLDGQYDFDCSVDSDSFPVKKPGLKKQDLKDKLLQKQTKQLENSVIDQTSAIPILDISNEKSNDNENNSILNDSLMVIEVDGNSSKTESEKKNTRIVIPETPYGVESEISHNSSCNEGKSTIKFFKTILREMRSYIMSQNSEIITITYIGGTMEKSAPMQYFSHQYPFLFTAIKERTLNLSMYSKESVELFWKAIMGECDSLYSAFSFRSEFIEIFKRFSLERLIIGKEGETLTDPSDDYNRSKALFDDCSWSNNTWEALAEASDDRCVNESVGINSLQSETEKGEEIYLNSPQNYEEDREFLPHSLEFDTENTTPGSSNSNHLNTPVSRKNSNETNSPIAPSPFTPMPNYDEMNTPTLKGECKRFGVKGLPKRKMKTILKTIYHGTHQYENENSPEKELPSNNDVTSPSVKKFKKSKVSKDNQKKGGMRNLNEKNNEIINEIRKNTELYTSILHYEPHTIRDFCEKLETSTSQSNLKELLEHQCVHYEETQSVKKN